MPLETLPNYFDAATHEELDSMVNADVSDELPSDPQVSLRLSETKTLLVSIVNHSRSRLNPKLGGLKEAKTLIKSHTDLQDMLASAWELKSYREIRNLAILQAPEAVLQPDSTDNRVEYRDLLEAFEAEYCGAAVHGFYEYLTYNEKCFQNVPALLPQYYAKFCSIVQSSGTGKSRMMTELARKDVVVIYMNLREKGDESFPARDLIPANILTEFPNAPEDYQAVCYAFLTALFLTLEGHLSNFNTISDAREWIVQMCDVTHPTGLETRADFFQTLGGEYKRVHSTLLSKYPRRHQTKSGHASGSSTSDPTRPAARVVDRKSDADVDAAEKALRDLSFSQQKQPGETEVKPPPPRTGFTDELYDAYKTVGKSLEKLFPDAPYKPKLVIAMDEAHPLSHKSATDGRYRPADILCRAVSDYTYTENHAVWIVFASTTSKVADFSPPNQEYNSGRVATLGQQLFPPFTQLGWDQNASAPGEIGMEDVARLNHIIGYGRPLWHSLKTVHRYQANKMLPIADAKLLRNKRFDYRQVPHVLAVLGQRFGVNITFGHPDSVGHLEHGVASHMRICLATTLDRHWRFTSYPSEPLLSCAAANALHARQGIMESALATLMNEINSGMIDVGQRGELASRFIWLLSKDLFIRTTKAENVVTKMPSTWEDHIPDCQMISVVDWLEFVFGPRIWAKAPRIARERFQNAYVNFSHWISMEASIVEPNMEDALNLDEWTTRHWKRSCAVQCCHQQRDIDKVIPVYFRGDPQTAPPESQVSQIFISDKARKSKDSKKALHLITRGSPSIGGDNSRSSESHPYIAILADLGQPPSFSVTFPEKETSDMCLRIYAAGVDATTYPFLSNHPGLVKTLQDLVHLQQIPDIDTPYKKYLDAQMMYGTTPTPEHMFWERGKEIPEYFD